MPVVDDLEIEDEVSIVCPIVFQSSKTKARIRQRKKRSLDSLVEILSRKVDQNALLGTVMKENNYRDQESEYEETVSEAFIKHLESLREKDSEFVTLLKEAFGEKLEDQDFFSWISKKIGFKFPSYLK